MDEILVFENLLRYLCHLEAPSAWSRLTHGDPETTSIKVTIRTWNHKYIDLPLGVTHSFRILGKHSHYVHPVDGLEIWMQVPDAVRVFVANHVAVSTETILARVEAYKEAQSLCTE